MAGSLGVPVVTTLHTPPVPWLESAVLLGPADHSYVTVSRAMERAWDHAVRSTVVANGVDVTSWTAGPGGRRALWSGRLVPEKTPHEAVQAARLAGLPIDLAGPVLDPVYFRRHVAPLLGPQVRYLGHLPQRALRHVVAHARVALVTPSWDEPFGLVAAEALACGTPVAAYARGALSEIVAPGVGALAVPGDVADLARAVAQAAGADRRAARARAVQCYSHDAMIKAYEGVYVHAAERDLVA